MRDPWLKRTATESFACHADGCGQVVEPGEVYWHNRDTGRDLCLDPASERVGRSQHKPASPLYVPAGPRRHHVSA